MGLFDRFLKKDTVPEDSKLVPGVGRVPYPAYRGREPYIFVSYAHKNMDKVLPIIHLLQQNGYRVWYDEGIDPGTEWADNIAEHLENAALLFACLSQAYMESTNCRDELLYARSIGMDILLMYLEKVQMEKGMAIAVKMIMTRYSMFSGSSPTSSSSVFLSSFSPSDSLSEDCVPPSSASACASSMTDV